MVAEDNAALTTTTTSSSSPPLSSPPLSIKEVSDETMIPSTTTISSPLPQPIDSSSSTPYVYIPYDELDDYMYWKKDEKNLAIDTLCWVLKSKGRQQKKKPKKKQRGKKGKEPLPQQQQQQPKLDEISNHENEKEKVEEVDDETYYRTELFLRARVVNENEVSKHDERVGHEKEKRVLVRYPKGSTYHVRCSNLIPVLEPNTIQQKIVLVVPETPQYRRASAVHTCVNDSFLEIGCDFGPCVDRVRRVLSDVGNVPRLEEDGEEQQHNVLNVENGDGDNDDDDDEQRVRCIGIDKSVSSIDIACERYPNTYFSLEDALTKDGTAKLRSLCKQKLIGGYPTVVAVDINGNRELSGVLECIKCLMQPGDDVDVGKDWVLPRLIIVKSRFLYAHLKE